MDVYHHAKFLKNYRKRVLSNKKLKKQFAKKLKLFVKNPFDKTLKNHPLKGKKIGTRAFSITGDFRVVYKQISKSKVLLLDIGTHNQVY